MERSVERDVGVREILSALVAGIALVGLGSLASKDFLLFHSLVEMFSVVVAFGIFFVVWNTRRLVANGYMKFLGIAFFFVGTVDALHLLAYKGMPVFDANGGNLGTQLWMIGRSIQAVALLVAPLMMGRRFSAVAMLLGWGIVTALLLGTVFYWHNFPACYTQAGGLTPFKKAGEYLICLVLVVAVVLLIWRRREFDRAVVHLLVVSIAATILSEFVFTLYATPTDMVNILGHLLKIVAFYLIYKAVVETALVYPYEMLFRDLKLSEDALRESGLRFRMIVDESPGGIVIVGRDGLIQYANPAAHGLLGVAGNGLAGHPFPHPFDPGKSARIRTSRPDGTTVSARMRVVQTMWEGRPAFLACMQEVGDEPGDAGD
jgi:PAS domain-containing protein